MNISDIISTYLVRKNERESAERGDIDRLHVGDVANGCPRAVWNRIHKGLVSSWDALTLKKFEYGHLWESLVVKALLDEGYELLPNDKIELMGIVGHPDIPLLLQKGKHLVEVKTTMLFRNGGNSPAHPDKDTLRKKSPNYIYQGCLYAKALGCESFTIYVSDRGTGLDADYEFITDEEWPALEQRAKWMLNIMAMNIEPEANPPSWTRDAKGVSYLCKKDCPVTTCRNNRNHIPVIPVATGEPS